VFNRNTNGNGKKGAKSRTLSTNPEEVAKGNTTKKSQIFESRIFSIDELGKKLELLLSKPMTILDKADAIRLNLEIFLAIERLDQINTDKEGQFLDLVNASVETNNLGELNNLLNIAERIDRQKE